MRTATRNGTFPHDARGAAELYLEKGLAPIPVKLRTRQPVYDDWVNSRITREQLADLFPEGSPLNIGILNGEPSGNVVDVDLDCEEARAVAQMLLPSSGWIFGRKSSPRSHWLYRAAEPLQSAQVEFKDLAGKMLVELRGDGGMTVYPPSVHKETGEPVAWERFEEPGEVQLADLRRSVAEVASAALLARHWPAKGSRDESAMALSGGLVRAGWAEEKASLFVEAVARAAGDEEARARAGKAGPAARKLDEEKKVTGWPTLARLLGFGGTEVVERVRRWLGLSEDSEYSEAQAWPDAIPLGEVPNVLEFPVEALPQALRALVEEIAWAFNCPPDFAGLPLLALAGGALANSRHIALKRTHTQAPLLYGCIVSPPGTAKSPVLKLLRRPLDKVQMRYLEEWRAEVKAWEAAEEDERGPRPILRRCIVSDITTESLGITLHQNPRGVVMVRDELMGLVTGMNQYKAGNGHDKQVYLSLWAGDSILIDRKSDKSREGAPIYVIDPFTAIIGSIQPAVLERMRGESTRGAPPPDDGFLDRFLFSFQVTPPALGEQWREVSEASLDAWQHVVETLLDLRMVDQEGERPRPFLNALTRCGRQAWQEFTQAHAAEVNDPDFPTHLIGPWSKMHGYCARLALILHHLRLIGGEVRREDVDGMSMERAARLVAYFKSHARKVYAVMEADPRTAEARKVVHWILANGLLGFQKRDAHQALRGTFKTVEKFEPVLDLLEKHGIIRPKFSPGRTGPGRKASPFYEVHPKLPEIGSQNTQNTQNCPVTPNSEYSEYSESQSGIDEGEVP